ncbi:DUF58 domain-containing protein [Stomatohabitans albus]|uniref:DUF58 domain-containing protein n=1 Tax=Stomatohabitans albus TaxID=3110766 RepID=UPI00300CD869
MINPQELRRLEFVLARRLNGMLHGDVLGVRHGQGSEIGDARLYEHGDDVRRIDWALVARTGETYVRDVVADREVTAVVLCDQSESMLTGTRGDTRARIAQVSATAFGYLISRGPNKFGVLGIRGGRERWWKPQSGTEHIATVMHQLGRWANEPAEGGQRSLGQGMERVSQLHPRRGVVAVVSDFLDKDWQRPLSALAHVHDTVCIRIVDPVDLNLPDVGVVRLVDPETNAQLSVDTTSKRIREAYHRQALVRQERIKAKIQHAGAQEWVIRTDQDPVTQMISQVLERQRVLQAMSGTVARKAS